MLAQYASASALTVLRHASGDSWRDWVATATALGGSAAHAYIRGPWQPTVVRRRADLRPAGRSDCNIAHHTQTWADNWCRSGLSDHTDAAINEALDAYPTTAPIPLLTTSQLRDAAATFKSRNTKALDGFHVRHFRLLSDAGLAVVCARW